MLKIALEEARRTLASQIDEVKVANTKAGILAGFVGVLGTGIGSTNPVSPLMVLWLLPAFATIFCAYKATWTSGWHGILKQEEFWGTIFDKTEQEVQLKLREHCEDSIIKNRNAIQVKTKWVNRTLLWWVVTLSALVPVLVLQRAL